MDNKAIGRKIQILLNARGMSVSDLANEIHVDEQTLQRWMDGRRQMTAYALYRTARYFNTTMDFLCEGIDGIH